MWSYALKINWKLVLPFTLLIYTGKKINDDVFNKINKQLEEKRLLIDTEKSQCIGEINDLDNRRDWINWITLHGEKIEQDFEN